MKQWMLLSVFFCCAVFAKPVAEQDHPNPKTYGLRKLQSQLNAASLKNIKIDVQQDEAFGEEAFRLQVDGNSLTVTGGDDVGAMYGLLDAAEQLRLNGGDFHGLENKSESPRFPFRAVKFNLPWSAYRHHAVVEPHMELCRDLKYWEAYLDMMAQNRFNRLTLWNLHPFPYMFRSEKYPEACGFNDEELTEWQDFWRGLFEMAHERGIKTYMVWWNIFVSPEFSKAHGNVAEYSQDLSFYGKGEHNELVNDYNRECVTQLINTYPDLDGIGISLGERMLHIDEKEREQWILDVIVEGMRKADRQVEFIHRAPFTSHAEITREGIESMTDWKKPIWVELKFNASHGHSAIKLAATHGGHVNTAYWDPPPKNYKMTWMMRNEDFVMLRWGQPEFIRAHIAENGQDYVGGYYTGSETYIPAAEYMQKRDNRLDWRYAFERDWLYWKAWGRLLYNPDTSDQPFVEEYKLRYGKDDGARLYEAVAEASKTPLLICSYLRGGNDPSLTAEHLISTQVAKNKTTGSVFIDLNQFITFPVLDPAFINIRDYVNLINQGKKLPADKVSPLEIADRAEAISRKALSLIEPVKRNNTAKDFEVADVEAWAHLAQYFALKVRAATAMELFRVMGDQKEQTKAVKLLEEALESWKQLSGITDAVYNEVESAKLIWITTPELLSWKAFIGDAEYDIAIAKDNIQTIKQN